MITAASSFAKFDHELTTSETLAILEKQKRLPKAIYLIMDHNSKSIGKIV